MKISDNAVVKSTVEFSYITSLQWDLRKSVGIGQLCPNRGPVEDYVRPNLVFRCSKSIPHTDNFSSFW